MKETFSTICENREQHFQGFEKRAYQIEKIQAILDGFEGQSSGDITEKTLADITPPSGGKTLMMAILAKIMQMNGIPSVIGVWNSKTTIYGEDNALQLFIRIFGEENIGIVDAKSKEYNKPIVFITAHMLAKNAAQFEHKGAINLMLDEGDVFQTDLRQGAIQHLLKNPDTFSSMYSATKMINGKHIEDWCHIVNEMPLQDLITLGYAKHIAGYYYSGDIEVKKDNIIAGEVDYDTLAEGEQKWMVSSAYTIYEKHQGQKTMIHCNSIEQCKQTVAYFLDKGVKADYVVNDTPLEERMRIEKEYVRGDLQVLVGVRVYIRSFSDTGVTQVEICAKISGSIAEIYQLLLRGTRTHPEYKTLSIYQLLPSTITIKTFVPVLMHDCFHIPLNDMVVWLSEPLVGEHELPIVFPQGHFKHTNPRQPHASNNDHDDITILSQDTITKIIDTNNIHMQITQYVAQNFLPMMHEFLASKKKTVFQLPGISRQTPVKKIRLGEETKELSLENIASSVFALISGNMKSLGADFVGLTNKRMQIWLATGQMPMYNERLSLLELKRLSTQELSYSDEFVRMHARDIFTEIVKTNDIKPTFEEVDGVKIPLFRWDKHWGNQVTYQGLPVRLGALVESAAAEKLGVTRVVTKFRPVLTHQLMWTRKETGERPKDGVIQLLASHCEFDYFAKNFDKTVGALYKKYDLCEDDTQFSFYNTDEISITITKDECIAYLQEKGDAISMELSTLAKAQDDFSFTKTIQRRYLMRDIMRKTFTTDDLVLYGYTWKDVNKYRDNMQPLLIDMIKKGELTPSNVYTLIQKELPDIPKLDEYLAIKKIDTVVEQNPTLITETFATAEDWSRPLTLNIPGLPNTITVSAFARAFWAGIPNGKRIETTILAKQSKTFMIKAMQQYIARSPGERAKITKDFLYSQKREYGPTYIYKNFPKLALHQKIFSGTYESVKNEALRNALIRLHAAEPEITWDEFVDLKERIKETLFPDITTLQSYNLNIAKYKKISDFLDEGPSDTLLQEVNSMPSRFFDLWMQRIFKPNTITIDEETAQEATNTEPEKDSEITNSQTESAVLEPIAHPTYEYTTPQEKIKVIIKQFFGSDEASPRHEYRQFLSQKRFDILRENRTQSMKSVGLDEAYNGRRALGHFAKALHPFLTMVRDELDAAGFFQTQEQKYAFYTTFLKKDITHHPLLTDFLLENIKASLQTSVTFSALCKSVCENIWATGDTSKEATPIILPTIEEIEEIEPTEIEKILDDDVLVQAENHTNIPETTHMQEIKETKDSELIVAPVIEENPILEIPQKYSGFAPSPAVLKTTIHLLVPHSPTQRHELLYAAGWEDKICKLILDHISTLDHRKLAPSASTYYDELHTALVRKVFFAQTTKEIISCDIESNIQEKDITALKEYLLVLYLVAEHMYSEARRASKVTREIARLVIPEKDALNTYQIRYDTFTTQLTSSYIENNLSTIPALAKQLKTIYDYVSMI